MNKRTLPVSNIERFAIHDGPGIRTTVFLQSCPLRCQWCANPEAQTEGKHLMFLEQKCVGCGSCVKNCPQHAITIREGKARVCREKCIVCGKCAQTCPNEAFSISGKQMTPDEIYDIVVRDSIYYEKTGGGVTFSGGEALLHIEEIAILTDRLRRAGIHTAVETCGYVPEAYIKKAVQAIALFLFDIKTLDADKMKRYTEGELSVVLNNFTYVAKCGPDRVTARIPVIPNLNHTEKEMLEIFQFLVDNHVKKADLLPYHTLGITKYKQLGKEYPFDCRESLRPDELIRYRSIGEEMGLCITIGG